MADQLPPGPELDSLVAKAGLYVGRFSTDPARILEMVAWLKRQAGYDGLRISIDERKAGTEGGVGALWLGTGCEYSFGRIGKTIPHALALLVVAVAKQEKP